MRNPFTTPPQQPTQTKPGHLNQEQVQQFFRDGFLQLDNFYDIATDLEPCRKATEDLVEFEVAQRLLKGGKITNDHKNLDLFHRLTALHSEMEGASVILHKLMILPEAYQKLWTNTKMLNVMEQLIGPDVDIAGHPVWNLRPKTPQNTFHDVPWHQDSAYLDETSYGTLQVTCWIPLIDTCAKNGCLQVVRGGHKANKIASHKGCYQNTWYIWTDGEDLETELGVNLETDVVTCEVPYGGVLLFSNLLPHRSLPNMSDEIRWSLDLRYQDASKPASFYGIKDGIMLRSQSNPSYVPDWDSWNILDRTKKQGELVGTDVVSDEFDFTITGPWMSRWPMVHENQHSARMKNRDRKSVV